MGNKKVVTLQAVLFLVMFWAGSVEARQVTDMFGRKYSIADKPQKVFSASPPMTYLLYAIDPLMIAGLNSPLREHQKRYLRHETQALPVLGGWFGQGNTPNMEMILKAKPDVIIVQKLGSVFASKANEAVMKVVPAPVMAVNLSDIHDYPEAMRLLGHLLGRQVRAKELAAYTEKTISDMKSFRSDLPPKKVSVYYAEGSDGLNTECDNSMHTEVINLAGGRNVHHCDVRDTFGMEIISFEQVMLYDPDVILVMERSFFDKISSDARWQRLRAVKNKKVHLIPREPFNWFDRPPSFMRLLGSRWLASILYPRLYKGDLVQETQQFFKLFLGVELTSAEIRSVLTAQ